MNAERYQQVCQAFQEALAQSATEREAYLAQLGRSDTELRDEVEHMLAQDTKSEDTFDDSAINAGHEAFQRLISVSANPGEVETDIDAVGPYRVLGVLGQGGMGLVYLCEQLEPIRRRVAVKLIKLGMDSKRILQRFGLEREALELVEHPGIARLLDAGVSEEGRPYFAMEYVEGASIVDACDQGALTVRERIEVLVRALRALQHAHGRGILHRDLKPSNLLVTPVDDVLQPKIIDFGLARAVDARTDEHFATRTGEILGTPAYMSPEQLRGRSGEVDVRSDVYSMGAVLYELLTGRQPFEVDEDSSIADLLLSRALSDTKTPVPSSRVGSLDPESKTLASRRKLDPRTLQRHLKGELDWIVMRAMNADPDRRYAHASDFADDLEAYLAHRPLEAGPPELGYRVAKYVRRHRVLLTAALLVAVSLIGGTVSALISASDAFASEKLALKAEKDSRDAAQAALESEQEAREAETQAREAETQASDAEAQARDSEAEARAANAKMEQMLGDSRAQNDILYRMLTRPDPRYGGRDTKVVDLLAFASEYALEEYGDNPRVMAIVLWSLGGNYRELGMIEEAEHHLRLAIEYQVEADENDHFAIATRMNALAILLRRQGKLDEAEELYRSAIEMLQQVQSNQHARAIATWQFNLAKLLVDRYEFDGARELLLESLEGHLEHDADNTIGLVLIQLSLGVIETEEGNLELAEEFLRTADELVAEDEETPSHIRLTAQIQLGKFLSRYGDVEEGGDMLDEALAFAVETFGADNPALWNYHAALADHFLRQDEPELAEHSVLETLRLGRLELPHDGLAYASVLDLHGKWLLAIRRVDEALPILEDALEAYKRWLPETDVRVVDLQGALDEYRD